jgi:hypothetical protein
MNALSSFSHVSFHESRLALRVKREIDITVDLRRVLTQTNAEE